MLCIGDKFDYNLNFCYKIKYILTRDVRIVSNKLFIFGKKTFVGILAAGVIGSENVLINSTSLEIKLIKIKK